MSDLPPGVQPHDSDPPEQKYWTGLVSGTVKVHETIHIRKWERCANEVHAMELAQIRMLGLVRERNLGLDCEAGDDFRVEPD